MKFVFLSGNALMSTLYNEYSTHAPTTVVTLEHIPALNARIRQAVTRRPFMRLDSALRARGSQISLPYFFPGLYKILTHEQPTHIFVLEFTRLWSLQALMYACIHRDVTLILLSETKRVPTRLITRIVFWVFMCVLRMSQSRFAQIVSLPVQGEVFLRTHGIRRAQYFPLPLTYPAQPRITPIPGSLRILVPARFVDYKRHRDVVSAVASLQDTNILIHMRDFAGEGRFTYDALTELINAKELTHKILLGEPLHFSSYVTECTKYDCIVLPSETEAFGIVVPLGLFAGAFAITSDQVGSSGYIVPLKDSMRQDTACNGATFIATDVPSLAATLEKIAAWKHHDPVSFFQARMFAQASMSAHKDADVERWNNLISR